MPDNASSYPNLRTAQVLIVDDVSEWRTILRSILDPIVPIINEATNGEEAIKILLDAQIHRHSYDLLLLDLMMPKMNGFHTLHTLRHTPGLDRLPIIVITTENALDCVEKVKPYHINGYIIKPFQPSTVLSRAESILSTISRRDIPM